MKKIFLLFSVIILISLSNYSSSSAQQTIDLNEAVNIAIKNNTNIANLEKSLDIQKLSTNSAKGNLYPDLSLNARWSRNNTYSDGTVTFQNGIPIEIPEQDTWINNFGVGVSSSVTLFDGFSNLSQIDLSEENESSVILQLDKQKYDLVFNINSVYFDILKKEKIVAANEENLNDSRLQLDRIKEFMDVGKVTMTDVYRQDVQVAQNELAVERSKNEYRKSKVDLLLAMNTDMNSEYTVSDRNIKTDLTTAELQGVLSRNSNTEVLLNKALANRYDYKLSEQEIKINQTQLEIDQKNLYYPVISAFGNYNLNASNINNILGSRAFNFGINIAYPIFQGFSLSNKMQSSEIQIKQKQDDIQLLKQQIRSEIKKSYIDLETQFKQIEILERNIVSAEQDKLLSDENYRVGLGTLLDAQTAATKLNTLIIDRINAYYDFLLAEKRLQYYIGDLK
ncbi:MAG TPA: TolC family protein [Ignavibacteria bacterium]|nr:TolC family protein [Ignavibacteria bacterium]HMR39623.1 TolC family protein [Ignavibacteria bacterium]